MGRTVVLLLIIQSELRSILSSREEQKGAVSFSTWLSCRNSTKKSGKEREKMRRRKNEQ